MPLLQTACDCPNCGDMLTADDSDPYNVLFQCHTCERQYRGRREEGSAGIAFIVESSL